MVAVLTGCTLLVDFDGLTSSGAMPGPNDSGVDVGIPVSDAEASDVSRPDAGAGPEAGPEAGAEAGAEAGPGGCAASTALFCEDFEASSSPLLGAFSVQGQGVIEVAPTGGARGSRGLRLALPAIAGAPADDAGNGDDGKCIAAGDCQGSRTKASIGGTAQAVRIGFALRPVQTPASGRNILFYSSDKIALVVGIERDAVVATASFATVEAGATYASLRVTPFAANVWNQVIVDVDLAAKTVTLDVDGVSDPQAIPASSSATVLAPALIELGVFYLSPRSVGFEVIVDDLQIVRVR